MLELLTNPAVQGLVATLIVSEVLPHLPTKSNGILQLIANILKTVLTKDKGI